MTTDRPSFADLMADADVPLWQPDDETTARRQREEKFYAVERAIMRAREELGKAMLGADGLVIHLDRRDWAVIFYEAPRHMSARFHFGQNGDSPWIEIFGAKVMERRESCRNAN